MKKSFKHVFCILIVICMCLSAFNLMPTKANAGGPDPVITELRQADLTSFLTGSIYLLENGKNYKLMENLVLDHPIILPSTVTIDLNGHTIDRNLSSSFPDGYIMYGEEVELTLKNTGITKALITGGNYAGEGCVSFRNSNVVIDNIIMAYNNSNSGGAISSTDTNLNISNCDFTSNVANTFGGALKLNGGEYSFSNCTFTGNSGADGGAINAAFCTSMTFSNCEFSNNTATNSAGALSISNSPCTIEDSLFSENSACSYGAISISSTSSDHEFISSNNRYEKNSVTDTCGALSIRYMKGTLNNDTFVSNSAFKYSAIENKTSDKGLFMNNVTVSGNSVTREDRECAIYNEPSSKLHISGKTIIKENTTASGANANLVINSANPLILDGYIDDSEIHYKLITEQGVAFIAKDGAITSGYSNRYADSSAKSYFINDFSARILTVKDDPDHPGKRELFDEEDKEPIIVSFDSNGGSGSMESQKISSLTPTKLITSKFNKEGYSFAGWALTPTGAIQYSDGELVSFDKKDFREITLFAVWKPTRRLTISVISQANDKNYNLLIKSRDNNNPTPIILAGSEFVAKGTIYEKVVQTDLPQGYYTVVVQETCENPNSSTSCVELSTKDEAISINTPTKVASSILDIKESSNPLFVDNLANAAKIESEKPENTGKCVELKLTVECLNYVLAPSLEDINAGYKIQEQCPTFTPDTTDYYSFVLDKTTCNLIGDVKDIGTSETTTLTESVCVLEIIIPFNVTGKKISICRYHDDEVQMFAENTTKADRTFYVDEEKGVIHIFTNKFSVYGINAEEKPSNTQQFWPIAPKKDEKKDDEKKPEEKTEELKFDLSKFEKLDYRLYSKYVTVNGKRAIKCEVNVNKDSEVLLKLLSMGYRIETIFYRGESKNPEKMEQIFITNNPFYTNTFGDSGHMYFYRAILKIYDSTGRYLGSTKLSSCKYANHRF